MSKIKRLARAMHKGEQFVRIAIQMNMIPGCFYLKKTGGERGSYYIPENVVKIYEEENR